jgi:acyl-CoA synthetase (AMP-forming)/AMP-acid ligase II
VNESLDAALQPIERVAEVAGGLRARGVNAGDVVAWQSPNRAEVNLLYRACWRIGAVAAPLHHQLGAAEAADMVARVQPALLVDDLDALPDGPPVEDRWIDAAAPAAILFTSGSSGAPKGVRHTQHSLAYKAVQMRTEHECTPSDCVLMPAPCAHISGLLNGITLPGVTPFPTVYMARWDAATAIDLIEEHGVTFMVGPPTFFVSMMQSPAFAPERVASMRLISSGGAGVSDAFVERASEAFGAQVKKTYGSTEAPTIITDGHAIGPVELKTDTNGELLVRGEELFAGYLDAEQNEQAFTAEGFYRTGDLATISAAGVVAITGRLKDIVIRGGENISITEVEHALESHPAIQHAVVMGEPDELMGERVVAFVETGTPFDLDACRAWFAEQGIAKFKTPERVVVLDTIPLLATGKPDREALKRELRTPG